MSSPRLSLVDGTEGLSDGSLGWTDRARQDQKLEVDLRFWMLQDLAPERSFAMTDMTEKMEDHVVHGSFSERRIGAKSLLGSWTMQATRRLCEFGR